MDLSEGLGTDVLQPILSNPEFMRQLREFLPPLEQPSEDASQMVRDTVQSPQFAQVSRMPNSASPNTPISPSLSPATFCLQALSVFSAALQSGQLGPLVQQFGLGSEAVEAAQRGDMEGFITALQNQAKAKKDDDDGMALD